MRIIGGAVYAEGYKRKPVLTSLERFKNVSGIKYVDIVLKDVPNIVTKEFIKKHNIDIVAHGHTIEEDEYYHYQYKDAKELGIFRRLEYTSTISTTEIINRIKNGSY